MQHLSRKHISTSSPACTEWDSWEFGSSTMPAGLLQGPARGYLQVGRVTVPGQYSPTTTTAHNATVIDGPPFHSTFQTEVLPHDALRANLGYKFRIRHVQRYAIAIPTRLLTFSRPTLQLLSINLHVSNYI